MSNNQLPVRPRVILLVLLMKNIASLHALVHVTYVFVPVFDCHGRCPYGGIRARTEEGAVGACDVCVAHLWAVFTRLLHLTAQIYTAGSQPV